MARELHDVVAHCMSVMVVQTSGARRVAASDLAAAREALKVVESAGREALVELRRIVGVLHRGDDEPAGASPGVEQLGVLVDRARAAGLPVELSVEGPRRSLPPGLDLVAYRIVEESLTNAIKHAGPAQARVHVVLGGRDLVLEVTDSGRSPARRRRDEGAGHGLIGMRERVRLYGGELHVGPRPGGGFEVRARIPLDGAVSGPQEIRKPRPIAASSASRRAGRSLGHGSTRSWPVVSFSRSRRWRSPAASAAVPESATRSCWRRCHWHVCGVAGSRCGS